MPRYYNDPNEIKDKPAAHLVKLEEVKPGPIHRVPAEQLTRIVRYVQTFEHTYRGRSGWLLLIIVCRSWRDTIYASPQLWSTITYRHLAQVQRQLKLSQSVPLSMDLGSANFQKVRPFKPIVPRFRRLKIHWEGGWTPLGNFLKLAGSKPILETLSLHVRHGGSMDDFFGEGKPPLRHLSIHGINPGSLEFKDLTILEIRQPSSQIDVAHFLDALHNVPRLVSLCALSVLCPPHGYPTPAYTPVSTETPVVAFPALKFFSFHGECLAQDLDFLSHLSLPSTPILLFSTGEPPRQPGDYAAVAEFLKVRTEVCGEISPSAIELLSDAARLKLNFLDGQNILCALKFGHEDEHLEYGSLGHKLEDTPDVHEMFSHLSYPTVTKFITTCRIAAPIWRIVSSCFPIVKEISTEEDINSYQKAVSPILKAIVEDWKTKPSSGWVPIFPRLTILSLANVSFDENVTQNFFEVLRWRVKCKPTSRLDKLRIHGCDGVEEDFIDELRRKLLAMTIDWVQRREGDSAWDSSVERHEEDGGEIDITVAQSDEVAWYGVDAYMAEGI